MSTRRADIEEVKLGREIVSHWMGLMRAIHLYDRGNSAILSLTSRILEAANGLRGDALDLEIGIRQDAIFLGGERLREGNVGSAGYHGFVDLLRRCGISVIAISEEAGPEDVELVASLIAEITKGERTANELVGELGLRGVSGIDVVAAEGPEELPDDQDPAVVAKRVYLRSIGVVKSVFQTMRSDGRINARMVKRVVQQMIESVDNGCMLNLTSLKNYDEYTFNHSVNVSVLAIALGRAVGLSRDQQYVLGQAGMLHDIGKLCVAKEVLNKPGRLTPDERSMVENHPADGLVTIASRLGVSDESIPVALAAFQHHVNMDGTGYPVAATGAPVGLLSRVVSVVDRYDAMTSSRIYRPEPISPAKALAIMYHRNLEHYDPALLSHFMNLMGAFPMGTTVRLTDGSVAIVLRGNDDPNLRHLPIVRVILDPIGSPSEGEELDLAAGIKETDPLQIDEAVNPDDYGIELMDYLL